MHVDRRIVVFILALSAPILIAIIPFFIKQTPGSHHFVQAMERYERMGLFHHRLVSNRRSDYRLSATVLDYSGDKTFANVRAELKHQNERLRLKKESVESELSFTRYVSTIAGRMTVHTPFAGRVKVGAVPESNHVNIVFLSDDPDGLLRRFPESLCAYVGRVNTILCNSHNVESVLGSFDKIEVNFTAAMAIADEDGGLSINSLKNLDTFRQLLKQNFLTWLIGHELGHAVLHGQAPDQTAQALHFDLVFDKREQEADLFVIKAIERDPVLRAAFPVMLLEYIEQEFRKIYRSQHHVEPRIIPAFGDALKTISVGPEMLQARLFMRSIRIMDECLRRNPKALEEATYAVINGQLAYIGSYKFPKYYRFLKSRIVLDAQSRRSGLAGIWPTLRAKIHSLTTGR